jgi:hypothetical protein
MKLLVLVQQEHTTMRSPSPKNCPKAISFYELRGTHQAQRSALEMPRPFFALREALQLG